MVSLAMRQELLYTLHTGWRHSGFLYSLFLAFKLWSPQTKNLVIVFLSILAVQIFLGVNNILSSLPLWNAVAHNIVGVMLFLTFIVMIYLSKGNLNEPK